VSTGSGAAGVSAQSPITAQVLAAAGQGQALRRKSRLQHVTAAESQASPSGLPQQATPGGAASQAEGLGQTPRGNGVAKPGEGSTPRTGGGPVYMTPPTGSAQRPAVSLHLAKPQHIGSRLLSLMPGCNASIQAANHTCTLDASGHCLGIVCLATLTTGSC
jgi:hypothetical protein